MSYNSSLRYERDPDIAGPGVLIGFALPGIIATLAAASRALLPLENTTTSLSARSVRDKFKNRVFRVLGFSGSHAAEDAARLLMPVMDNFLLSLRDQQLNTGLLIIILAYPKSPIASSLDAFYQVYICAGDTTDFEVWRANIPKSTSVLTRPFGIPTGTYLRSGTFGRFLPSLVAEVIFPKAYLALTCAFLVIFEFIILILNASNASVSKEWGFGQLLPTFMIVLPFFTLAGTVTQTREKLRLERALRQYESPADQGMAATPDRAVSIGLIESPQAHYRGPILPTTRNPTW
ncbi:hypothetical protein HYFRA_00012642 [Hymenoscyphus fraxineus]|uniref:Uncharacterized protein n=1 Tax=Hymenoscyphus fraxineus TaxID=746836 RepID=A0A9N9L917_9HELO|nr:hypothetical protein HYFRA_00012642 [Hymenoscyphus fraxineus]